MTQLVFAEGADSLITAIQATRICGVTPQTVRKWCSRGYIDSDGQRRQLSVAQLDEQGHKLFRLLDVAIAERATRYSGRGRKRRADELSDWPHDVDFTQE